VSSETPELGTRRTLWPQAAPLQQAADKVRPTDPELAAWLEETANALSWLAPYRDHEPGHGMWQAAEAMARRINEGAVGAGGEVQHLERIRELEQQAGYVRATALRQAAEVAEEVACRLYDDLGQRAFVGARLVVDRLRDLADERSTP